MKEKEESTKISISKPLHDIVKLICLENGLKMQFLEDKAIKEYIASHYPQHKVE